MDMAPTKWRFLAIALLAPMMLLEASPSQAQNRGGDGVQTSSAYLNRQFREAREDGVITGAEAIKIERLAWILAKKGKISWREARRIDRWQDQIGRRRHNGRRDGREDNHKRRNYRYD